MNQINQIHCIPSYDDDDDDASSVPPTKSTLTDDTFSHRHYNTTNNLSTQCPTPPQPHKNRNNIRLALLCYERSAMLVRDVGSAFVKNEAIKVKRKLINDDAIGISSGSYASYCIEEKEQERPSKKLKRNTNDDPVMFGKQESSILVQASRMKRMSILLRNIEVLNGLFCDELVACCRDVEEEEEEEEEEEDMVAATITAEDQETQRQQQQQQH